MARVLFYIDWEREAADAEVRQALTIDPGNAEAFRFGAMIADSRARFDEALDRALGAVSRDPLSAWNYFAVGYVQQHRGQLAEAEAAFHKSLELRPTAEGLRAHLGFVLVQRGDSAAGLAEIEREPSPWVRQVALALALEWLDRKSEADRAIAVLEQKYSDAPFWIAGLYANRNDPDRAFAWLDRACRQHDTAVAFYDAKINLKKLEADPRYEVFMRKMKVLK